MANMYAHLFSVRFKKWRHGGHICFLTPIITLFWLIGLSRKLWKIGDCKIERHLVIQNQILGPILGIFGGGFLQADSLENRVCVERVRAVNGLVFSIDFDRRKTPEKNENAYEQIIVKSAFLAGEKIWKYYMLYLAVTASCACDRATASPPHPEVEWLCPGKPQGRIIFFKVVRLTSYLQKVSTTSQT